MTAAVPLPTRPLTPTEVLDGLRDLTARATGVPWEHVAELVTFDTPIAELYCGGEDATDHLIEKYFGTGPLPPAWWQRVDEFGTVGGLCHALASFAEVPVVEKSSAFDVVRAVLANVGADVSDLRPSSPLLPYLWLWPDVFQWELPRLAPGRVPDLRFRNRRLARRLLGIVLGLVGLVFAYWVSRRFPWLGGLMAAGFVKLFIIDLVLTPWAARAQNWSVEFGTLYDFRDLAAVLAGEREHTHAEAA